MRGRSAGHLVRQIYWKVPQKSICAVVKNKDLLNLEQVWNILIQCVPEMWINDFTDVHVSIKVFYVVWEEDYDGYNLHWLSVKSLSVSHREAQLG